MGNQSPNPYFLVLMAGLPGTGKSTLATALSQNLQWHHINKDGYREVLIKQGLDEEKASWVAYELAFDTAHRVLTQQKASVILDCATLYKSILENAMNIVRSIANAQLKIILSVANREIRDERLRNRPSQVSIIRFDPETIDDYLQYFNKYLPSNKLTLYTNQAFEKSLLEAKAYLKSE